MSKPVEVDGIEVFPQRNDWSCGPMALRYCLARWGIDVPPEQIADMARSTRRGTSEINLIIAAYRLGCDMSQYTVMTAADARRIMNRELDKGHALILCIDKWTHWVATIHRSNRGYLVFDSNRPGPVIQFRSWKWMQKHLRYVPKDTEQVIYSFASLSRRPVHRNR